MKQLTRRNFMEHTALAAGLWNLAELNRDAVQAAQTEVPDRPIPLATAVPKHLRDEFFISYWWGPEPSESSFKRIADAHFTVAQAGGGRKTLDLAKKYGLKVVLEDARIQPYADDFQIPLDALFAEVADHPALWGYHIIDEPDASKFPALAKINQYLLDKDPQHVPYINLFPTYALPDQLGVPEQTASDQLGAPSYTEYVDRFLTEVKPVFLSYDHYAMFDNGTRRADFYENLEVIRHGALRSQIPFNYILLSCPHFSYRNPSRAELLWQVNSALVYGAHGIQYFTYLTPPKRPEYDGWHDAITTYEGEPLRKYEEIKAINADVLKLAPLLMRCESTGVYHTEPCPSATTPLSQQTVITEVRGNAELVIGFFRDPQQGETYMMFVNRSETTSGKAQIVFDASITKFEAVENADITAVASENADGTTRLVWNLTLEAGERQMIRTFC